IGVVTLLDPQAGINALERVVALNDWGQALINPEVAGATGQLWTPRTPDGAVGSLTIIPDYNGDTSVTMVDLNDYGQVIAESSQGGSTEDYLWTPERAHGNDGEKGLVTLLDSNNGDVQAINDYGQVLGLTADAQSYLWTPTTAHGVTGTKTLIAPLSGDSEVELHGLSDAGVAIGTSYGQDTEPLRNLWGDSAVAWVPTHPNSATGQLLSLGTIGSDSDSYGDAISSSGEALGVSCTIQHNTAPLFCQPGAHTILWDQRHGLHNLGSLLDQQDQRRYDVGDSKIEVMNDAGEIVLFADTNTNQPRLVLLTPHPTS
ncbi:MAG TPA: hypothetical protein VKQ36_10765, partial [Ktedonobacterales bacterium]|nr:hypothetical protein [Ktedonobacterales bacterium]